MARIIDKDTRLIDIDFGGLDVLVNRLAAQPFATSVNVLGNGRSQLLNEVGVGERGAGSYIQYNRLDLSHMVMNNEVMLPVEISVQRTSPVPLGFHNNGNNFDQIEEYVYVFSRPLNNTHLASLANISTSYEGLRDMGLDGSESTSTIMVNVAGAAGWPTQAQCIYAEKRMYSYNESLGATQGNGGLIPTTVGSFEGSVGQGGPLVAIPAFTNANNTIMGMPVLDSVTNWGAMGAITGPNLHVYRIVINRNQTFPAIPEIINLGLPGQSQCRWPPVSIRFLCKDPNYTEGEYLTRLANAMNNTAEDGPTA